MTESAESPGTPRDAQYWAKKVDRLSVSDDRKGVGYNVEGRRVTGPQQGFGRLWQREYWTDLGDAVTPEDLVADWRQNFGTYWPRTGVFHGSLGRIEPGDVAALQVGGAYGPKMATGIIVVYADDESFTFMTPEGHMFAGMITFSGEPGTRAHIRVLLRTNDPLWEMAWPVMKRKEDVFWAGTLGNVAAAHGVLDSVVEEKTECLDRSRMWSHWRNVWHNAGIRSGLHMASAPIRAIRGT
jgi:hypothetical protein